MILQPGTYFVGDLGFVLPPGALRAIFSEITENKKVNEGYRTLCYTDHGTFDDINEQIYWVTSIPYQAGTLFDQTGKPYGFDWFIFGCMRFNKIFTEASYDDNKVEFKEPFSCSSTFDTITIGHLNFTQNLPNK